MIQIKSQYRKEWEEGRRNYKETTYIEEGKEEITLKTMYPKWVSWIKFEDEILVSSTFELFRGETEQEARLEATRALKTLGDEIGKMVEEEEKAWHSESGTC